MRRRREEALVVSLIPGSQARKPPFPTHNSGWVKYPFPGNVDFQEGELLVHRNTEQFQDELSCQFKPFGHRVSCFKTRHKDKKISFGQTKRWKFLYPFFFFSQISTIIPLVGTEMRNSITTVGKHSNSMVCVKLVCHRSHGHVQLVNPQAVTSTQWSHKRPTRRVSFVHSNAGLSCIYFYFMTSTGKGKTSLK